MRMVVPTMMLVPVLAFTALAHSAPTHAVPRALTIIAPESSGFEALDRCTRRLDPQTDLGYERIAARCPDLTRALESSRWAGWLPADWKTPGNDLSAGGLKALRQLVSRESATRTSFRTPELTSLQGILTQLAPPPAQECGWWTRVTRWLREGFARRDRPAVDGWLSSALARVSPSQVTLELISYLCLAVVVVMALLLVLNELRVAGLLSRWRTRQTNRESGRARAGLNTAPPAITLADIQRAPIGERPGRLLALIAARLTDLGRLPPSGAFTVRELLRTVRLARSEDAALLGEVALSAERMRFSQEPVQPGELQRSVDSGRRLLEHLQA